MSGLYYFYVNIGEFSIGMLKTSAIF